MLIPLGSKGSLLVMVGLKAGNSGMTYLVDEEPAEEERIEDPQSVNIFDGIETLSSGVRDELAMVSEQEFVDLDKGVQCHEYEGDTVDEVAEAVVREYENENADQGQSSQDDLSHNELPLVDEQDVIANRFAIKTNKDPEDILDALETYCFN